MDQAWWSTRTSAAAGQNSLSRDGVDLRSVFEHDRARVLHSRAFRRLQHKTQVFTPQRRDFYRTRLTHSLECSQIGKALALNQWPEGGREGVDLVEAACLAHDIGHPPFGHRGEAVLHELSGAFEGNAQTIRVLVRLEEKKRGYGLDLTRATLASVIKYPVRQGPGRKKFLYEDDAKEILDPLVFDGSPFGLKDDDTVLAPRPFPLQLMEWADDVAYSTHDVEDGINAGFISALQLSDPFFFVSIVNDTLKSAKKLGIEATQQQIESLRDKLLDDIGGWAEPPANQIKEIADERIHRFVVGVTRRETGEHDWLYGYDLVIPPDLRLECEFLKMVARECVFRDSRVTRMEYKGEAAVRYLFERILEDAKAERPQILTRQWRRRFRRDQPSSFPRIVCDYIASMSDVFCLQLYAELTDPSLGTPFVTT